MKNTNREEIVSYKWVHKPPMIAACTWSGTDSKEVICFEPETIEEELEQIVANYHEKGQPLLPVGSAISPNTASFNSGDMISL